MVSIAEKILQPLAGRVFASYRTFESEVIRSFNSQLAKIPAGYSYRNLINFGMQEGAIFSTPQGHWYVLSPA